MGRFPKLLTGLFRDFRNSYNEGVDLVDQELESQKKRVDDLIKGTTQPSEVVDARGEHTVLRDRLNKVDSDLTDKATKTDIANMGSASPKGTYATLAALQTAFPTGTTGIYVVATDGKWYYWNGSSWTSGGVYQSTGLADNSITPKHINNVYNMFNQNVIQNDKYIVGYNVSTGVPTISPSATQFVYTMDIPKSGTIDIMLDTDIAGQVLLLLDSTGKAFLNSGMANVQAGVSNWLINKGSYFTIDIPKLKVAFPNTFSIMLSFTKVKLNQVYINGQIKISDLSWLAPIEVDAANVKDRAITASKLGDGAIQPISMGFKSYPFVETARLMNNSSAKGFNHGAIRHIKIFNGDTSKRYYVCDFWNNHVTLATRRFSVKSEDNTIAYSFLGNEPGTGIERIKASSSDGSYMIAEIDWSQVITQTYDYTIANTELAPSIVSAPLESKSIPFDAIKMGFDLFDPAKVTDNTYLIGYNTTTHLPTLGSDSTRFIYTTEIPDNNVEIPYFSTTGNNALIFAKEGDYYALNIANASLASSPYVTMADDNKSFILDCVALKALGYVKMIIQFLKVADAPYISSVGVLPKDFDESTKALIKNSNPKKLLLPTNIRVLPKQKFNIYLDNVIRYGDTLDFHYIYATYVNYFIPRSKKHLEVNAQYVADYQWRMTAYERNRMYENLTKNVNVKHVPVNSGDNTTKKVMFIGDSLTDAAVYTQHLLDKFNAVDELMNIELLGTRGTGSNKHEGRSGWRAWEYANLQTGEWGVIVNNPFFNPATSTFDFNYYMTNQGYSGVDIVAINLGTNDIARPTHNEDSDIIDSYNTMISSIKAYNPNVKILLWLPPLKAQFLFTSPDQKDKAMRSTELFLNEFDNREAENIFLVPVYLNVDPERDYWTTDLPLSEGSSETYKFITDNIHPNTLGYKHIGDVIYPYLKYVGGLV